VNLDELDPAQPMNNAERYELTVFAFGYVYKIYVYNKLVCRLWPFELSAHLLSKAMDQRVGRPAPTMH
jgi:hypothetical protein